MLDTLFLIRLILAFIVGAIWVSMVTAVADRRGSAYAILGGLPSTAAFSLLFIAINQSPQVAVDATVVFPIAFSMTNAFLIFYAYFTRRGFKWAISISLLIWFFASIVIVVSGITNYVISLVGSALISILIFYLFAKKLKIEQVGGRNVYPTRGILLRGVGAGALVATSVFLNQIGGPILGGVAAAFPAVYTSTMIILYCSRGLEFSKSTAQAMAYSGILTVIPYSIAVHYLYPALGIWVGTLSSYLLVAPLSVLSYYLLKRS